MQGVEGAENKALCPEHGEGIAFVAACAAVYSFALKMQDTCPKPNFSKKRWAEWLSTPDSR